MKQASKLITLLFLSFSQFGCLVSSPMHWNKKSSMQNEQQTVVLAVTHVKLGNNTEENNTFWVNTHRVLDSITQHEGHIGYKVRRTLSGREAWTLTLWQDEASLKQFVKSRVHDDAARLGFFAVSKARSFNLTMTRVDLQTDWQSLEELMDEHGESMY